MFSYEKLLSLILALSLVLSLAACGKKQTPQEPSAPTPVNPEELYEQFLEGTETVTAKSGIWEEVTEEKNEFVWKDVLVPGQEYTLEQMFDAYVEITGRRGNGIS